MTSDNEREVLTEKESVEMKRSGESNVLRVPAHWRRTFPFLKNARYFEGTIERDKAGGIFIVFRKIPLTERRNEEEER